MGKLYCQPVDYWLGLKSRDIMTWVLRLVIFAIIIMVIGCARQQIPIQSIGYNKALADSANKQLLLNIVRSYLRILVYFNTVGELELNDSTEAKIDLEFPLVDFNIHKSTITPKASLNTGLTKYSLKPLNKSEFIEKMHTPVGFSVVEFYLNSGWRPELLFNLAVKRIRLKSADLVAVKRLAQIRCANISDRPFEKNICAEIDKSETYLDQYQRGNNRRCGSPREFGKFRVKTFENHGRDPCRFIPFQNLVRRFLLTDVDFEYVPGRIVNGKEVVSDAVAKIVIYGTGGEVAENVFFTGSKDDMGKTVARGRKTQGITLRSLQGIIYYLGELTAASLDNTLKHKPSIVLSEGGTAEIFRMERGLVGARAGIMSVNYGASSYFIPRPNSGAGDHRSTTSLTFAKQLLEFAILDSDIPTVDRDILLVRDPTN